MSGLVVPNGETKRGKNPKAELGKTGQAISREVKLPLPYFFISSVKYVFLQTNNLINFVTSRLTINDLFHLKL